MYRRIGVLICILCLASTARAEIIDGENFVDPTRPLFYIATSVDDEVDEMFRTVVPASYDISFIRAGGDSSFAVINSVRVREGDVIGGARVVAIDRAGVTLFIDNQERRIDMYQDSVKSTQ